MPFSTTIVEPLDLLFIKAKGQLTPQGLLECVRAYRAHPAFHSEIDMIFELKPHLEIDAAQEVLEEQGGGNEVLDEVARQVREARGKGTYRTVCAGGTEWDQHFFLASIMIINRHTEVSTVDTVFEGLELLGRIDAESSEALPEEASATR